MLLIECQEALVVTVLVPMCREEFCGSRHRVKIEEIENTT